ncbi:hypothetical protein [Mycolicibacterium brisbanense]
MAKTLGQYAVHLTDDAGVLHSFLPGDEVPDWAAKRMGAHCFATGDADEAAADGGDGGGEDAAADGEGEGSPSGGGDEPPPLAGPGSGRDHWAAYAREHQVAFGDDDKRDQIVDACREAGVRVE